MVREAQGFGPNAPWNACYIDGEWQTSNDGLISVLNPATGEAITHVPEGGVSDIDRAFEAATAAQDNWASVSPTERADLLRDVVTLIEGYSTEIKETVLAETGGTQLKVEYEVEQVTPQKLIEAASFPSRSQGKVSNGSVHGKENFVHRDPKGVVGCITPWNFPLNLTMRAVAPAIALGNAVVLKPSEETPISGGLLLARLFERAGLPPGVLNVVPGYGETAGARVAEHPDLDVLCFTGSTAVGRSVAQSAVQSFATPLLELGGNNAHIVLEDADIHQAVDAAVYGSFVHQGQVCISINRHLVHENHYEEYVERLTKRASDLSIGDPSNPDTDIGPLVNTKQRDRVIEYIDESIEAGAVVETGGSADGRFVEPTVLSGVTNDMPIACEEHFGPVAPVIQFDSADQAVDLANDTKYGLSGSVHSKNIERARRIARRLETGMVHVNDQPINGEPNIPFGGVKASGMGRYNGSDIIHELTEQQWVSVQHESRDYPI